MDKASALGELLDIITSCPDGGDIRPVNPVPLGSLARPCAGQALTECIRRGSFPLRRTPTTEKKRFIKCNGREQCWWEWEARRGAQGKRGKQEWKL